jgi:hypothetical protein
MSKAEWRGDEKRAGSLLRSCSVCKVLFRAAPGDGQCHHYALISNQFLTLHIDFPLAKTRILWYPIPRILDWHRGLA